jgi:hypothetical protein
LQIQIGKSSYDIIKVPTIATVLFFLSRDSPGVDKQAGAPLSISFHFFLIPATITFEMPVAANTFEETLP